MALNVFLLSFGLYISLSLTGFFIKIMVLGFNLGASRKLLSF
uniref:Uncharacterized protein n=2 Tax=Klebsiella TaxID=570 RepID=A0A345WX59_KLEOX|nr:hypothetical protein [Klebsiella oxytoca]AXJ98610.1 hypothetical protein [Klebsiella pneumoniae]